KDRAARAAPRQVLRRREWCWRSSSDALRAREQAGWLEDQDGDDDHEAHRVTIAGRDVARAELLGQRQDEAADHGAGDVAETAEDDDGEGLDGRKITHL